MGALLKSFHDFVAEKAIYATYFLKSIPGNLDLHGSTAFEQSHSSVLFLSFEQ